MGQVEIYGFNSPPSLTLYCMRSGQSAIPYLIRFVLQVVTVLICLVQAMSDDDFLVGLPAGESSSDSSFVVGKAAARRRGAPVPARLEAERDGAESSDSGGFMVGEAAIPRRHRQRTPTVAQTSGALWALATAGDAGVATGAGKQDAMGLVRVTWALKHPAYDAHDKFDVGTLEYMLDKCLPFEVDVPLPDDLGSSAASVLRAVLLCQGTLVTMEDGTNKECVEFLEAEGVRCETLIAFSQREVDMLNRTDRGSTLLRSMRINSRGRFPPTIGRTPSNKNLRLWRIEVRDKYREVCPETFAPGAPAASSSDVDHVLYLPPGDRFEHFSRPEPPRGQGVRGRRETDPVRVIHCINVAQHLRQPALFQEVLEGCVDYLGLEEANPNITHDYALDPTRRPMDRGLARADVVAMSLQRRLFKQWRQEDRIKSINIYSDASPVVGAELQGMVIDVNMKDDTTDRIILPGSTLAYGFAGTMSKSVALVHALWLVCGPSAEDLRWVCSKVLSMTTDFGVEMHLLEAPDMIDAYLAHMTGTPFDRLAPLVKHDVRLFARALRIAGWSHTLGGIMKTAAETFPGWPMYLKHERALCKFFKNVTYRQHIVRKLGHRFPELRADLRGFTAGFAKWRYETEVEVLRQLLKLRDLCENKIDPALFTGAQDQEEIGGVFKACKDAGFWKWANAAHRDILSRLETCRKWGMVCNHSSCEKLRKDSNYKKHIPCDRITLNIRLKKNDDSSCCSVRCVFR